MRQHSRKFNNALALACELVEEPNLADGSGWQPPVVIQGKLYHLVGPLQAGEGSAPKRPVRQRTTSCVGVRTSVVSRCVCLPYACVFSW